MFVTPGVMALKALRVSKDDADIWVTYIIQGQDVKINTTRPPQPTSRVGAVFCSSLGRWAPSFRHRTRDRPNRAQWLVHAAPGPGSSRRPRRHLVAVVTDPSWQVPATAPPSRAGHGPVKTCTGHGATKSLQLRLKHGRHVDTATTDPYILY